LGTLVIRFAGIFLVLGILQISMRISSRIFIEVEKRVKAKQAAQAAK
jgi:hypothetical protein